MSDYVRKKAIRLRVTDYVKLDLGIYGGDDNYGSLDDILRFKLPNLTDRTSNRYFEVDCSDEYYYIDYVYYYTYGEEFGDWGNSRYLSQNEWDKVKDMFSKICPISILDLRRVDFCYYNCSEAPDYFDIEEFTDDSELL